MKEVCLVQMPYTTLTTPSLALGILKSCLNRNGISCKVFYGDLQFAERLTYKEYMKIGYGRLLYQMGEASFAGFVWDYQDAGWRERYLEEVIYSIDGYDSEYEELLKKLDMIIPDYLEKLADAILFERPRIVGCSSNFQQNNASLALLKIIKKRAPEVITIMGGCNCALEAGQAIAAEVDWIDYTFSGDGEQTIPQMCRMILDNGTDIPAKMLPYGVMNNDTAGQKAVFTVTEDLNSIPIPDYDEYFDEVQNLDWLDKKQISLSVESSRGCWWHEKRGCTFCGLCMTNRKYRRKDTRRFLDEVLFLEKKYGIHYFFLTDSILSNEAMKELPDLIANCREAGDLRFFSEIKSNLSREDMQRLRNAGFYYLQPGIEALQDDLLKAMNKGNRAIKHVELLKNARRYKIRMSWNLLFGFPGERDEWVWETIKQIPFLTHLQPPNWGTHIIYQKYSHYYEHCGEYGLRLKPLKVYDYIYGFQKKLAQTIAYNYYPENPEELKGYFNLNERGEAYACLISNILKWHDAYYKKGDCLQMIVYPDHLDIMDLRAGAKKSGYKLGKEKRKLYLYCDTPRKKNSIISFMEGYGVSGTETISILNELKEHRLMISIGEEYLSLAVCIAEHN